MQAYRHLFLLAFGVVAQLLFTSNLQQLTDFLTTNIPEEILLTISPGERLSHREQLLRQAEFNAEVTGERQADEIRQSTEGDDPAQEEALLRCDTAVPPYSVQETRGVEITVESSYQGEHGGSHVFSYEVEFNNKGRHTVQMLTRHWVFTDSEGKVKEVKGPGARGETPILGPGDTWRYQSGSQVAAPFGSMRGSFQMEVLDPAPAEPAQFLAPVPRLALSADGSPVHLPCGHPAAGALVPTTAVHATWRIIAGVTSSYIEPDEAESPFAALVEHHRFAYDVQINNARTQSVKVLGRRWEVGRLSARAVAKGLFPADRGDPAHSAPCHRSEDWEWTVVEEGEGVGGMHDLPATTIGPGDALRYVGAWAIEAPSAIARGVFRVAVGAAGAGPLLDEEVEVSTGVFALSRGDEPVDFGRDCTAQDDDERRRRRMRTLEQYEVPSEVHVVEADGKYTQLDAETGQRREYDCYGPAC